MCPENPHDHLAVVIPAYQGGEPLVECLATVEASEPPPDWVCVVDNASRDGSIERASQRFPRVEFVRNASNLGFGAACNHGLEQAIARDATFVLLLNQDAALEPTTLASMVSLARQQPRAGAIGCLTLAPPTAAGAPPRVLYNGAWKRWLALWQRIPGIGREHSPGDQHVREVDFVWGHAMLLRSSALREVGLFDRRFFMYMEDLDLCDRLQRAGWQIWCDSRTVCWHAIADSARGGNSDDWRWQMKLESIRVYYRKRHSKWLADLLWLLTALRECVSLLADGHWRASGHVLLGMGRCAWGTPPARPPAPA
jgi:N-acetylglucosaminyl-diphospho-decaprenol L-rhamnosyltransferase